MCNFTGYKGRAVVSEVLELDTNISNIVAKDQPISTVYEYLRDINFSFIKDDAKKLIENSITTLDEYYTKVDTELL